MVSVDCIKRMEEARKLQSKDIAQRDIHTKPIGTRRVPMTIENNIRFMFAINQLVNWNSPEGDHRLLSEMAVLISQIAWLCASRLSRAS